MKKKQNINNDNTKHQTPNTENRTPKTEFRVKSLSKHLFWEYDTTMLSPDKDKRLIINRVLEYGVLKDWLTIKKYYGLKTILSIVISERQVDEVVLHFIAGITNTPLSKFRCYKNLQSQKSFNGY